MGLAGVVLMEGVGQQQHLETGRPRAATPLAMAGLLFQRRGGSGGRGRVCRPCIVLAMVIVGRLLDCRAVHGRYAPQSGESCTSCGATNCVGHVNASRP